MKVSMYDKLLELPLFQGLTKENITSIIEKVKMGFHKYDAKQYIALQDTKCNTLIFILNGKVSITSTDKKKNFRIEEQVNGPYIIEPYSLFGMHTNYQASYSALNEVETLNIDKSYILTNLCKFEIFNLNYLNIISNRAQNANIKLWNSHIGNTREKFMNFLALRCIIPHGRKTLFITMEDLASLIDDTRINVSRALNELQEKGILTLSRKKIIINDLSKLIDEIKDEYTDTTDITNN